ncbi:MAG: hypothetical protein CMJ49_07745 [Planctomycetaceae bacterium]|nr:hypothetical protein [Planctomycetaceae bacterium]
MRCRWLLPEVTVPANYVPVLALEIQNVSEEAFQWDGYVGIRMDEMKAGWLLPEGVRAIVGRHAHTMTEQEVSERFGIGRMHPRGANAPMEGYYHFDPGGLITVVIPVP